MECITIINCIAGVVSACASIYCAFQAHRINATAKAIKNDVGSSDANSFINSFLPFESLLDGFGLKGEDASAKDVIKLDNECESLIKEVRKNRGTFSDEVFENGNKLIDSLLAIQEIIRNGYELDEPDYDAIFEKATPYLNVAIELIHEIIVAVRNSSTR